MKKAISKVVEEILQGERDRFFVLMQARKNLKKEISGTSSEKLNEYFDTETLARRTMASAVDAEMEKASSIAEMAEIGQKMIATGETTNEHGTTKLDDYTLNVLKKYFERSI